MIQQYRSIHPGSARGRRLVFQGAILAVVLAVAYADQAQAQGALSKAFPNGAQRGATVEVTFAGTELPEDATLIVDGGGIKAAGPFKKGVGKVEIAPDAALGVRQLRLSGPKGVTSPRPFSVGALPELLEKEPNGSQAQAQRVESLPVTLNGVLPTRGDLDLYTVSLKQGECLVVAGESRSLGAPTNLLARIRSADGRELVAQVDHRTRDPLLGFTAPADGDYTVEFQDVLNNYSGINADYVYRVTLTKGAWLDSVFPNGGQRGQLTKFTFTGWNLGGKNGPTSLEQEVAIPPDAGNSHEITAGGANNRIAVVVGTVPEIVEQEQPPLVGTPLVVPQRLTPPITVNGVFGARGDVDRFVLTARKGERLHLDVDARQLGSYADPVLVVRDAVGAAVSTIDDADGGRDPRLQWTAPADGEFTLTLRDIASGSRGGPQFFYRLRVAPPAPDLRATISTPTLVVVPGKDLAIAVKVTGVLMTDPISLTVEGLPAGVTASSASVSLARNGNGSAEAKVTLSAIAGATPGCTLVRVIAKSGGLAIPAVANWILATDRSGTLAEGSTEQLALLVPAP